MIAIKRSYSFLIKEFVHDNIMTFIVETFFYLDPTLGGRTHAIRTISRLSAPIISVIFLLLIDKHMLVAI